MPAISYTPILPEHVYSGLAEDIEANPDARKLADVVLENKPSGNNYIDMFANMVRRYGKADAKEYAGRMGAEFRYFDGAVRCLTGMSVHGWVNEYLRLVACDLVAKTTLNFKQIGKILGFSQSSFSQFFRAYAHMQPWEYRNLKRHGRKRGFFYD
ncbi:MAG: helix-turn-helix domain-containing protein [Draconibacterium sp.]